MEKITTAKTGEVISQKDRLSPNMAFVAIINKDVTESIDKLAWRQESACTVAIADGFYPEVGGTIKAAKELCANCKVREICLEYALAHKEEFGVWGGKSVRERRKLLRERSEQLTA